MAATARRIRVKGPSQPFWRAVAMIDLQEEPPRLASRISAIVAARSRWTRAESVMPKTERRR